MKTLWIVNNVRFTIMSEYSEKEFFERNYYNMFKLIYSKNILIF